MKKRANAGGFRSEVVAVANAARDSSFDLPAPTALGCDEPRREIFRDCRKLNIPVHGERRVRRQLRRPIHATRRTEASRLLETTLAREGHQSIVPAGVAMQAQEAMRQHDAAQKRAQLLFDEAGSGLVSASRACEEGLEVLADDLVEQATLGLVALILDGGAPSRDRVLAGDASKFDAVARLRGCWSPRPLSRSPLPSGAHASKAVNLKPQAGASPRSRRARGGTAAQIVWEALDADR